MRLRTFIMASSAVVAIGFFGGSYVVISRIFDHAIKQNALQASAALAQVTFNGMYQIMSTGWRRKQAEAFIESTRNATRNSPTTVQIFRGAVVAKEYGEIQQPALDETLHRVLGSGQAENLEAGGQVRNVIPLNAEERCLRCHDDAQVGDVMGAIDVRQDLGPLMEQARREFVGMLALLAPLAMIVAAFAVWVVNRRIERSIELVDESVSGVNAVADLKQIRFDRHDLGFDELNRLFAHLGELVDKLKGIAIDKEVLRFEIGLLEKFVITSDVVRDWKEYIAQLLADINQVVTTHVLFSVFQVGDELFDLEIFWSGHPDAATRDMMERHVRGCLAADARFSGYTTINVHHHEPKSGPAGLVLDEHAMRLHTKTFTVDQPKIGGIVGIGVNAAALEDETVRLVMDSVLSTMLNVVGSIKAIYKYTRDLEYYATRDPLTDLFNRRVFWDLLAYEMARARRHDYSFTLMVIDLDNFKLVNDSFGHGTGDRYLQEFATAVKHVLRLGDVFARYGGDEFALFVPEADLDEGRAVAERVLEAVERLEIRAPDGTIIKGTVSIGLAVYPVHSEDPKDLLLFADNMMYKAKSAGKHRIGVPTGEDMAAVFRNINQMNALVLNAISERKVVPFFQPILELRTDRVLGYEVLSRINDNGNFIEAEKFIEFAEKAGVIHRLDAMVIEQALDAAACNGFDGRLFINLSPRALVLVDFVRTLKSIVAASGIAPERIVFEITERDTVKNITLLEKLLNDLKFEGFNLAIDDFGSGFSSFQYLRRFSIDYLKLEGDFIMNILDNPKDRSFVSTMSALAAELDICVVAEHVETAAVLAELRQMGMDYAQGRHVGRPQPGLPAERRWVAPNP